MIARDDLPPKIQCVRCNNMFNNKRGCEDFACIEATGMCWTCYDEFMTEAEKIDDLFNATHLAHGAIEFYLHDIGLCSVCEWGETRKGYNEETTSRF